MFNYSQDITEKQFQQKLAVPHYINKPHFRSIRRKTNSKKIKNVLLTKVLLIDNKIHNKTAFIMSSILT